MSWARAQSPVSNSFASSSSAETLAFGSNTTSGNLLVVGVITNGMSAPTLSVSDSVNGAYTAIGAGISNGGLFAQLFYVVGTASGANTVTVNPNLTNVAMGIAIAEYSGNSATPLDGQGTASGTNTLLSAGSVNISVANDLCLGVIGQSGNNLVGTGANSFNIATQTNGTGVNVYLADRFPDSAPDTPQVTVSSSVAFVGAGASFKISSGGGGGSGTPVPAVVTYRREEPTDPMFTE